MEDNKSPLPIGDNAKAHLMTAGKWARFVAIMSFVGIGLVIVSMLFALLAVGAAGAAFPGMPAAFGTWYFSSMLCAMAIFVIPTIYLYRFGVKAQAAVKDEDEAAMTHSIANLGRCFRFIGIYTIVMLAICVVAVIIIVIASVGAAAAGIM